jgi:dTDP-4-dehydrorhamnose 3,5-epimerase
MYLCSATYSPLREHAINPLDPELGLAVPEGVTPVLSVKDAAAPSLSEAAAQGLLPRYDECVRYDAGLASGA